MNDIHEHIWNYGQLTADQQLELDAYVQAHPELLGLLDEVKRLHAFLREARMLSVDAIGDEALAYYIAQEYFDKHPVPEELSAVYARMSRRIAEDPVAMQRYRALKERMEHIASFSDPASEFERLTGFSLGKEQVESRPSHPDPIPPGDRAAVAPRRRAAGKSKRFVFNALVVLGFLGVLFWLGNTNERLAYTDPDLLVNDSELIARRALDAPLDSLPTDVLAMRAQTTLRSAQRTWLNCVFWYNKPLLDEAERMFLLVLDRDDSAAWLNAMASYFVGKINLARGDEGTAISYLERTARMQDVWSEDAAALLKRIQKGL